jgi:type I restriction-modification system DNA methylase subunit
MANLFGYNAVRSMASRYLIEDFEAKLQIVQSWQQDFHKGSLRTDKETSREQAFNKQFFGEILGYVEKPRNPFTFEPKASSPSGQLPDARLGFFQRDPESEHTSAVVELKGAGISLDKPQKGHGGLSPVQQGFKYKPQYRNCDFVIVSNFYETRLYNDTLLDFEVWTLDDLVDPTDDYWRLRTFIFLLSSENLVSENGESKTKSFLSDIRVQQEDMGKKFYGDYKEARSSLISELWLQNDVVKENPEVGIEKAQKILDRVVFSCFAEDKGFIPDATLARVLKESSESSFGTVWGTLRTFFEAIDVGSEKLGIPVGFNGGLFAKDSDLDNLVIGDETLRKVLRLGNYNFTDDLSVTILGHIFEQSISDLEEIREEAQKSRDLSAGRLSQRKRDGIFYTPDHVVRAIVDKSLGEFLRRQEAECLSSAGVNDNLTDANFAKRQNAAYSAYLQILQGVKVIDPACGSGAFIVAAFDYLLAENKRVNDVFGPNLLGQDDYLKQILQNNIFGVDLNEESVEITKLSLWLKSASLGQKLTKLDSNIKCGNSLISDPAIGGPKAFDWHLEFPEIFKAGGFDVVIGNPPYVDSELMVKSNPIERNFISQNYESAQGNWDLFVPFYQKAFDLLKPKGFCSMIVPNKILVANYASKLRSYLVAHGALVSVVDLSAKGVFEVDVYPVIVTTARGISQSSVEVQTELGAEPEIREFDSTISNWGILLSTEGSHETKGPSLRLDEVFQIFPAATVAEAYELKEVISEEPPSLSRRVVNTGTIDPFIHDWGLFPMTYIKGKYLHPVAPVEISHGRKPWHTVDKVIVAGMSQTIEAVFSKGDELFPAKSTVVLTENSGSTVSIYACLVFLNSEAFRSRFVSSNKLNAMAGGYITISKGNLSECRIPASLISNAKDLDELGKKAVELSTDLRSLSIRLMRLLQSEFGDAAWSSKFKNWWDLDFPKFIKALGVALSISAKGELLPVYEDYVANAKRITGDLAHLEETSNALIESLYLVQ